jgi:hypothetical protein
MESTLRLPSLEGWERPGLLRWVASVLWWNLHSECWTRLYGQRFRCPKCEHRFRAVPAQHGYDNACPHCLADAFHVH